MQLEIGSILRQARQHIVAVQESHESAASHIDVPGYYWIGHPGIDRRKGVVGFIVLMQQQNNRTDSMIIGIGAAHSRPCITWVLCRQSARVAETHDRRRTNNTNQLSIKQLKEIQQSFQNRLQNLQPSAQASRFYCKLKPPPAILFFTRNHNGKFDTGSIEPEQIYAAQLIKLAMRPSFCSCSCTVSAASPPACSISKK